MSGSRHDAWTQAWIDRHEEPAPRRRRLPRAPRLGRGNRRAAVLAGLVLTLIASPFAVAAGLGRFEASDDRYTLLARNTRDGDGGAGALACNSDTGNHEPCLNMVNIGSGYAAAFRTRGLQGFRLQTSGNGVATPFVLDANATGKVTHFNADAVDGLDSSVLRALFARVNTGTPPTLGANNGATAVSRVGAGSYRVEFAQDVNNCGYQVTPATPGRSVTAAAILDPTSNRRVNVTLRDATADNSSNAVDGNFYIAVNC